MRILYRQSSGVVCVVCPAPRILTELNPDTGELWTVEDIAKKDVPTGYKYKIVEDSDVPTDRSFRDAWTVDETDLTDGVGADYGITKE
tara:strand:+ start:347 stop:610 length:264 start_codon:yes stop_codon:yes gene_type:complete